MTKEQKIAEMKENIAKILQEPDIGCIDWEIGKTILVNWKASLPDQILSIIQQYCSLNAEREL